jgi:hypothetical protein
MNRGGFSKLIVPGYKKVFLLEWKLRPIEGEKIVNKKTSKRAYEEEIELAGLGTLVVKPEGGAITYQDGVQGGTKRYTHNTYGLGFRVTEEIYDDELYNVFGNRFSKSLAQSARNNKEIIMHAPYNNAFDTAYAGFTSGESLCSTAHTLVRGGTASNRPAVDADFELLPFQAAIEHFHGLDTEEDMPALLMPKYVLHSAGDHWIVNQILKTDRLPGTDQNDINQAAREGVMPLLSHYLTDTDAWFVVADQHDVNYYSRRETAFSNTDDFDSGDAKFKVTQRNSSGWGQWRGIYGSQGA